MKLTVRIKSVSAKEDLRKAFAIRRRVFINEQEVPEEIELDRDDARALHLIAFTAGKAVGTARLVLRYSVAKIGRMAVLKSYRGKGIGKKLLKRAIIAARSRGARKIYLHAQLPVIGFYEGLGFRPIGPVFKEANIPHRKMILPIRHHHEGGTKDTKTG
jgi:predicted GNAT family N-acyltransferase